MSDDVITVTADPSHMSTVRGPEHDTPEKLTEVAADSSCAASDLESDPSSSAIVPDVVGRCVDCSCPYDRFSGLVVCTVCRLPVLVCDVCAEEKCYPGEYHCFRHRYKAVMNVDFLRATDMIYLSDISFYLSIVLFGRYIVSETHTYTQAHSIPHLILYIAPDLPLLYHFFTCLYPTT